MRNLTALTTAAFFTLLFSSHAQASFSLTYKSAQCSKGAATDLSKHMLSTYPGEWKWLDSKDFPYSFAYPAEVVPFAAGTAPSPKSLYMGVDWCGKTENTVGNTPIAFRVVKETLKSYRKYRSDKDSLDTYAEKNTHHKSTIYENIQCGDVSLTRATQRMKTKKNFDGITETLSVEHGPHVVSFIFNYDVDMSQGEAVANDFITTNNAIECNIASSLTDK